MFPPTASSPKLRFSLAKLISSVTQDVTAYTFKHNDKTIHLIDTPGFDDTYRTDSDVLRDLAYYLTSSYGNGYRLSGIIYLHPITHNRLSGTAFKNMRTFRKLCGVQSMSSTVLATTMWSGVTPEAGSARELELKETAEFWGDMIREGSTVYRHTDDHNSAINIISFLTDRDTKTVLDLQTEMVDQKRSLEDTEAGREVDREMSKQRGLFEKRLEHTRHELKEAIAAKDDQHVREIMQEQEKFESKLAAIQQGREELRISMEALIAEKEKRHDQELAKMNEQLSSAQLETKKQADEWEKYKEQTERQRKQDEVETKKKADEWEKYKEQMMAFQGGQPPSYQEQQQQQQQQPPPPSQGYYQNQSYDGSAEEAAFENGVGLATGVALTGAVMLGGCTVM